MPKTVNKKRSLTKDNLVAPKKTKTELLEISDMLKNMERKVSWIYEGMEEIAERVEIISSEVDDLKTSSTRIEDNIVQSSETISRKLEEYRCKLEEYRLLFPGILHNDVKSK